MISGTTPTLGEMGVDRLKPPTNGALPLNNGMWTMPHYQTFIAFMNTISRSYWWTFDEALHDSLKNSDAMRNDIVVRDALSTRYRKVCGLEWQIEPDNKQNKLELTAASKVTKIIKEIPYFQQFKRCLMEAIFFGKYGVQPLFKWDYTLGYKRMVIKRWYPVHGDKILFKWDGTPGILVNPSYSDITKEQTERGPAHFLTPEEEESFIWHEFEPEDASYYKPEYAGTVHGSGMRGRIYWWWWLRQNLQRFMMNFVKKAGNGYLLVAVPAGNPAAMTSAKTAVEGQEGNNVIYVPVDARENETIENKITHVPVHMTGAEMQWTVITGINELIRNAITAGPLTSRTGNTGLGSNLGEQHGMTEDDQVKYDATDLETPMQKLTNILYKYNCPMIAVGKHTHLADKRNPEETMKAVDFGMKNGLPVPVSWVQDELGIPAPTNGEPVLAAIQPMQATAVGNVPQQTPMVGPSGPPGTPQAPPVGQ